MLSDSSATDKENADGRETVVDTEEIPYRPLRPTHIDIKDPTAKKVIKK